MKKDAFIDKTAEMCFALCCGNELDCYEGKTWDDATWDMYASIVNKNASLDEDELCFFATAVERKGFIDGFKFAVKFLDGAAGEKK